jgi:nucleotide-binding universal stress UspA family protein
MYSTILVPLDGSKRAEAILPHVEELSRRYGARVIFLQVVELGGIETGNEFTYQTTSHEIFEHLEKQAELYLESIKGEFRERGIEGKCNVMYGPVVEAIINTAEIENADLIALASHGRSGLARVFFGSVAVGVLHRAERPLLLIRSHG